MFMKKKKPVSCPTCRKPMVSLSGKRITYDFFREWIRRYGWNTEIPKGGWFKCSDCRLYLRRPISEDVIILRPTRG